MAEDEERAHLGCTRALFSFVAIELFGFETRPGKRKKTGLFMMKVANSIVWRGVEKFW